MNIMNIDILSRSLIEALDKAIRDCVQANMTGVLQNYANACGEFGERIAALENQVNVLVGQIAAVDKEELTETIREIAAVIVSEHESDFDHGEFISGEDGIIDAVNDAINNLSFEVRVS